MRRSEAREHALKARTTKQSSKKGKVWLVGAGPSDPGLFTLKGKAVLSMAEVVVYDALVSAGVLAMIPDHAERIYVGKRAGDHAMAQEQINELLVKKALEGKRVVRLKGGDPFLFGRGAEEILKLREHGIAYEVVPGVTSAIAVPAYNGIPVTDRNHASSVHIITGHKRADKPLKLPFEAYVKTQGTLVFLMGLSALSDIVHGLLHAGMDPKTPAAVMERGTTAAQRRVIATLHGIEAAVNEADMQTPAIIVVGSVVELSDKLSWYEKLPLFGRRFVLTRPKERMDELTQMLRMRGAEVIEQPVIETKPMVLEETVALDYDWLVFTSPAGVHTFIQMLWDTGRDVRSLGNMKIAVIGSGTKSALREYGLVADLIPEVYDGESLGTLLGENLADQSRVLIARSSIGNPKLVTCMRERASALGKTLTIKDLAIYQTLEKKNHVTSITQFLAEDTIDGIYFTSASTVRAFLRANTKADPTKIKALCIGEMTANEARKAGMNVYVAEEASVEGLLQLTESIYTNEKK